MTRIPGTSKTPPPVLRRSRDPNAVLVEGLCMSSGAISAACYTLGECQVLIAREPYPSMVGARDTFRWHASISHPSRYPTWDDIKAACWQAEELRGVLLAQVFMPGSDAAWVNVHDNCLHIVEIDDPVWRAQL